MTSFENIIKRIKNNKWIAPILEDPLIKAEALQSAIFNSANFSSIATDANGVIQIFNVGAENMLGYRADEVLNKITPADISDPQELIIRAKSLTEELDVPIAPGFEALVFKASRGIEDIYELTYIRKDGSRFPAIVSVTALRDDEQAIIGYLLIGTDNTARKQADEALIKAGALQNAIFNSANFSSIATDANGVIQIFNVGAENMLGYKADDVMNKITPADISDPQEVIARAKVLTKELETPIAPGFEALVFKASRGIEDIYELTYIRKDGSRFPAIVSVTALRDDQQAIIGYLLIGTDNTARKQADEVIKKLTLATLMQAEELVKSKAQFLANMSHEIRTPMNGIIGFSELALLREMPFDIRDYLTKINTASTGLLGILNDILDLSKLDAGSISLDPVLFAVNDLRNMLNTLFVDSAEKKGLAFSIEVGAGMPKNMIGDELRLQQVLVNLLSNAIKFTINGSVSLSITLLESDSLEARILCCVKDTGIGISAKGQSKLFQLFSQADDSITRRFGGTGLGLVLSNKLVQLMGGKFMVESTPGLGSSFSFELVFGLSSESFLEKIQLPSATFSSALQEFGQQLVGIRILVVEDNLFNQQIIREFLDLAGISVEIANNGKEALAFLGRSKFDAVLMDIHMPVMDGFAATRKIRSQSCFAKLPVIALTAGVTEEERGQCLAAGMSDFISKPINSSQLLSMLVQWVKSPAMSVRNVDTDRLPVMEYGDDVFMSDLIDNVLKDLSFPVNTSNIDYDVSKPILDWAMCALKDLVGDDPDTLAEFLNYFHVIAIEISAEIIAAIRNGEVIRVGDAAHKLKSSAFSVGAIRLGDLCAQLESAGKSGNEAMLKRLLPAFEREWCLLQEFLLAWPDEPMFIS
jgi:PAS domain S-box-containing protein